MSDNSSGLRLGLTQGRHSGNQSTGDSSPTDIIPDTNEFNKEKTS